MFDFIFDKEDRKIKERSFLDERNFIVLFLSQMYL
ncbi:hypothetical protein Cp4431_02372 [Clostridium perfringens]|nr:hypothetical protein [Clostridium perfringens]